MATSSITKNFVISGEAQAKRFADAIEESYQESLVRVPEPKRDVIRLSGAEELRLLMEKRKRRHA